MKRAKIDKNLDEWANHILGTKRSKRLTEMGVMTGSEKLAYCEGKNIAREKARRWWRFWV